MSNQTYKPYKDESWLRKRYLVKNQKVVNLAKECKVNRKTINWWLRHFKIPKRKKNTWNQGKEYSQIKGEKNPNWKGDDVGYKCLHDWVRKYKPKPNGCEQCGKEADYLEVANISGEYKRDINDYRYLCASCHKIQHIRGEKN